METNKDPPKTKQQLNSEVYFNVNLKDNINWQPMHLEISPSVNFVILGQYTASRDGDGFKVAVINFFLYNSDRINELYVKEVKFLKDENDIIELNVLLDDKIGDEKPHTFTDERLKKIRKKKIIDLHLYYKDFDTRFKSTELFEDILSPKKEMSTKIFNIGHHICKSLVIDPNS